MRSPSITPAKLLAALIAGPPGVTSAAILAIEPFDYPNQTGSGLAGLNGGTGWNSNAYTDTNNLPTLADTNTSLGYPTGVP